MKYIIGCVIGLVIVAFYPNVGEETRDIVDNVVESAEEILK